MAHDTWKVSILCGCTSRSIWQFESSGGDYVTIGQSCGWSARA